MKFARFSAGGILGIIFRHIKESPKTLAELYVFRDRSLVYKWLHDSATPSKALVAGIVSFVMDKTCEPVRLSIRKELVDYVSASGLQPEIASQLIGTVPFQEFMKDMLHFAISLPHDERPIAGPASPQRKPWRARSVPLAEMALAILAVFGSGMLWNVINRVLGWIYYMGGEGREPRGFAAAIWGLTVTVPIILAAMASRFRGGKQDNAENRPKDIAIPVLYALSGMIGSLVFYNIGVRAYIEGCHLGYSIHELIIGFAFASLVSMVPLGVIVIAGRSAGKSKPRGFEALGYALLTPLMVVAAVSFTFFVARPIAELEQLRGFLAGLMLRTGMYIAARGSLGATSPTP